MANTEVEIYRLAPKWTPFTNPEPLRQLIHATKLRSFSFDIAVKLPKELAAQIFNALETKAHLTSLSLRDNFPDDSIDEQPGFVDYFCKFLLRTGRQLERLKFYHTEMKIERVQRLLETMATSTTSLRTLIFSRLVDHSFSNFVSPEVLKLISLWISKSNLTELRLTDNLLTSNDMNMLFDGLSQNKSLTKLDLSKNRIGDTGILTLATCLESKSSITWLDLSSNKIGDGGISSIAFLLKKNSALKRLDLIDNLITIEGVRQLSVVLKANKGLAELYLDTPPKHIDKEGAVLSSLIKWAQFNSSIKHLSLNDFQLDDSVPLLGVIEKNTSITSLSLARTKTIDFTALAKVLRNNKTLLSLDLTGIQSEHATDDAHADFLQSIGESNLTRVNLSHGSIYNKGCEILAEALAHNQRLLSLNLSDCGITAPGTKALAQCLAVNKTLLELDLSQSNSQSPELFNVLLTENHTLTSLTLRRCNFNACKILCEIITNKQNFHSIDLSNNYQVQPFIMQIATAMHNNKSIVKLLCEFENHPQSMNIAVATAPQLMRVVDIRKRYDMNLTQVSHQSTWLARKRFKAQIGALRAAQIVLLAPDRGVLSCLPTEILELIFSVMAGHSSMANDFLVSFAKQRDRLKYERDLTNRVDFLRGYLKYLHSTQ